MPDKTLEAHDSQAPLWGDEDWQVREWHFAAVLLVILAAIALGQLI